MRSTAASVVIGVALGLGAVAADRFHGTAGQVLQALLSSGLAWGAGAVVAGALGTSARRALAAGGTALTLATLTYYGLIVAADLRPDAGAGAQVRAAGVWLAVSAVGGPACGALGHRVRHGTARARSIALGAACGVLAAPGIVDAVRARSYLFEPNARGTLIATAVVLAAPAAVLVALRRTIHPRLAWAVAAPVALASAAAWGGALLILGAL